MDCPGANNGFDVYFGRRKCNPAYIHTFPLPTTKKQQQNVQPTLKFFPSDVTIYLPFNFLQLFFAFAVKVNSMGLLTEFFMIHNFSFSFFSVVGSRFFRFTFDDIFIGFLFIFVFASSLVQPFTIS